MPDGGTMTGATDAPESAFGGACCPTGAAAFTAGTGGLSRFVRRGADGRRQIELLAPEVHCAACIQTIESRLPRAPGIDTARVNLTHRRVAVGLSEDAAPEAALEGLAALGYEARPFDADAMRDLERDSEGRALLARLAVAGFAMMNVMLLSVSVWSGATDATRDLLHWVSALIALPAAAFAGTPFFRNAILALRAGRANMDVPISLAVLLAMGVSVSETIQSGAHAYFDAAVSLLFFLLIGRYLDHRTRRAARVAAAELCGLQAHSATLVENGMRRVVPVEDLRPGDVIEVAAGERAPADGEVVEGLSDLDRSMITGESAPEAAGQGAEVHAGVVNLSAPLRVRLTAVGDETLLAGIARMIDAAENAKTRYTRLADHAARVYVPVVHVAAAAAGIGWILWGMDVREAVMIAAAVLIITCPCALALAVPAVHAAAGGRLFRAGVFLKDGAALERLALCDVAVFDKTGTLTEGAPRLASGPDDGPQTAAAWAAAAALAGASRHPFSQALAEAAAARGVIPAAVEGLEELPGRGMTGRVAGVEARLGRGDWCEGTDPGDGFSSVWLKLGDAAPVRFAFEDPLKADAAEVVAGLKARGFEVALLSGDAPGPVARAAAAAGIEAFEAAVTPAGKLARLEDWAAQGRKVMMVGDGINDAPALAAAEASISPSSAADVSRAAAGFVFTGAGLSPVLAAVDVARAARRRALENFQFAGLYNLVTVPLAAAGFVTPLIAALAMSSSSIIVTLNALRIRRMKGGRS
ncbi:heavy metal translocating P-type ATPase [Rhodovulum sp. DZ06]|uniref:heavy metal translocating P-type ATPase n=1 Tax=Rhodovulum sp. DZ06 TaxID=3425126 RepID=UPI003D32C92B